MNRTVTAVLVALCIILGAYTWYTQFRTPEASPPDTTPSATPVTVFNFLTDSVQQLQVKDLQSNATVLVTRQDKTWHMLQPKDSATDPSRVDTVVGTLAHLSATRVLTSATDLAAYGLITGTIQASVTMTNSTQYSLKIGDATIDQSSYYALKGNESQVYLISSSDVQTLKDFISQPPYPPTVTPTPLPSLTPSQTPTVTTAPPAGATVAPSATSPPSGPSPTP